MTAPYDPRAIANLLLAKAEDCSVSVTPLALQKLIYFAHGQHLVLRGVPLVGGYFEAWKRGPVHPFLYHAFKSFGSAAITGRAEAVDPVTGEVSSVDPPQDGEVEEIVERVLLSLRRLTPGQLVALSHAKEGPWDQVWKKYKSQPGVGIRISDELIRTRFNRHKLSSSTLVESTEHSEDAPPE